MKPERQEPGRPSRRERERRRYEEEILAAAAEMFARYGYDGTGMKQIAERVELSVGKIYSHFDGKEDIFRELVERHVKALHKKISEACDQDEPPLDQLRCVIVSAIDHFKENLDFMMIYQNENPLKLQQMIRDEIRKTWDILARLFAAAIERSDITAEDPEMLAAIYIGAAHKVLHLLGERGRTEEFETVPDLLERIILDPLKTKQLETEGS